MTSRKVIDWGDAADDAYSHLRERKRVYSFEKMALLIDDLALRETVTQDELLKVHSSTDFLDTAIGHVTTAIHGAGAVPKIGGWYRTTSNPHTYHIEPAFAAAWRAKRRLPR